MPMIYQRRGGPILNWASGYPPRQTRAAETRELGDAGDGLGDYVPTYALPGAPEIVHGMGDMPSSDQLQSMAGMAIGAYHGYKRNKSLLWAALWGAAGGAFPLFTGIVALAQGFAKPK